MIESPPALIKNIFIRTFLNAPGETVSALVEKINETYEYWSDVKYKKLPGKMTPEELWTYVKAVRIRNHMTVWEKYHIQLTMTNQMQRMCHEFDMNFGGSWGTNSVIPEENKEQYLISSLMEEAISSSQMEGASTPRKVAKEMLRKKITPRDKSQQMIFNNYRTIRFIVENKDAPLSRELLLKIHALMTENTLDNPQDVGRFRMNDEVVVEDGITHETVHIPPPFEDIPEFVEMLCRFFNEQKAKVFLHPVIRSMIIHFMLAYVHPFVDGNGRTARALFYWYMLKQGYWLTEYLSISRVIAKSKKAYEKSFLYVEQDENDIGYFIAYHLRVLEQSFNELQKYIKRKIEARKQANTFLRLGNINERQAEMIRLFFDYPHEVVTIKDLESKFRITPTTAKNDVKGLLKMNLLAEISFNKVKKGYIKGEQFDEAVKSIE